MTGISYRAAAAVAMCALLSVAGCHSTGSAPEMPAGQEQWFSAPPARCDPLVSAARTEIAAFAAELYSDSEPYTAGGIDDEPRTSSLTCSGGYARSRGAETEQRSVYLAFTVHTTDLGLETGYRVTAAAEGFVRGRPEVYQPCHGIGDDCYVETEGAEGQLTTKLMFRAVNLVVLVRLATRAADGTLSAPDDAAHARAIAEALAGNLDALVPR